MNYLQKRKYIDRILIKLYSCKTSDEFYQLSTRLYYYVNDVVYGLHSKKFDNIEEEKNER